MDKFLQKYNADITSFKGVDISEVNWHVLPRMKQRLQLKAYSDSTIRTYLNEMAQLLHALGDIPADELKPGHLKRYLRHSISTPPLENFLCDT